MTYIFFLYFKEQDYYDCRTFGERPSWGHWKWKSFNYMEQVSPKKMDDNNNNEKSLVKVVFWAGRFTFLLSPSQEKAWRVFPNQIRLGFVGSSFYLGVWTWQFWTKYSCGRYASVWGMTLSNWNILVPIAFPFTALKAYRTWYHYFYLLALLTQSSVDYMLLAIGCVILRLQMNKHIIWKHFSSVFRWTKVYSTLWKIQLFKVFSGLRERDLFVMSVSLLKPFYSHYLINNLAVIILLVLQK